MKAKLFIILRQFKFDQEFFITSFILGTFLNVFLFDMYVSHPCRINFLRRFAANGDMEKQ
jgi:hypothetical protein